VWGGGGGVGITQTPERAEVIVGGLGAVEEEVWGEVLDGA
jgi:hypothetical protein